MSEEARNLTKALKGDTKTQGSWGEVILESILEKSGLVKGREYIIQQRFLTEEGRRVQPDVIIKLPQDKRIIIRKNKGTNKIRSFKKSFISLKTIYRLLPNQWLME